MWGQRFLLTPYFEKNSLNPCLFRSTTNISWLSDLCLSETDHIIFTNANEESRRIGAFPIVSERVMNWTSYIYWLDAIASSIQNDSLAIRQVFRLVCLRVFSIPDIHLSFISNLNYVFSRETGQITQWSSNNSETDRIVSFWTLTFDNLNEFDKQNDIPTTHIS